MLFYMSKPKGRAQYYSTDALMALIVFIQESKYSDVYRAVV